MMLQVPMFGVLTSYTILRLIKAFFTADGAADASENYIAFYLTLAKEDIML